MLSAEEVRSVLLDDLSKIESSMPLRKVGEQFSVKKSDTKEAILSPENMSSTKIRKKVEEQIGQPKN